jgi:hypothetical protein
MEFEPITEKEFKQKSGKIKESSWTPEFIADMKETLDAQKKSTEDKDKRFRFSISNCIGNKTDADGNESPKGYIGTSINPVKSLHSLILNLLGINYAIADKQTRDVVSDNKDGVIVDLTLLK